MATKAFKKGQAVTLVGSWDNKGTVYYRDAIVYSCGKKQMVLTDAASRVEIGRHFDPTGGSLDDIGRLFNWEATYPRMNEAETIALCHVAGARIVASAIAAAARRDAAIAAGNCNMYQLDISKLHETRALNRTGEG